MPNESFVRNRFPQLKVVLTFFSMYRARLQNYYIQFCRLYSVLFHVKITKESKKRSYSLLMQSVSNNTIFLRAVVRPETKILIEVYILRMYVRYETRILQNVGK